MRLWVLMVFAAAAAIGVAAGCGGDGSSQSAANFWCLYRGGDCDARETKAYETCMVERCDPGYRVCLGEGYKSGSYGGPCGTYAACRSRCGCSDTACITNCGPSPAACMSCYESQLGTCGSGCKIPKCGGGFGGFDEPDGAAGRD